ncbi:prolyl oligopeptidase family serine peptidase [uncultured Idiomarina sp.]|uniref:alpha/beta hydrolase family protein n=1 Tax=uncultured Idiomarina sp. TaxID=352961 RepID=UPI0025981D6F|nr:prolyl oligopeptidase family serine peptidase [uncultured Idiomarina sp.]
MVTAKQFPSVDRLLRFSRPDRLALCPTGRMVSYSQLIANNETDQFDRVGFIFDAVHNLSYKITEKGNIRQFLWLSEKQLLILWDQGRFDDRYHLYSLDISPRSKGAYPRKVSPLEVDCLAAFKRGVIFNVRNNKQIHYLDLLTTTHLVCDYTHFGEDVLHLASSKLSPETCIVTLSDKTAGINRIYRLTLESPGKFHWLPLKLPTAYGLCVKAVSDCNQWFYAQGSQENKRYAQQKVWKIGLNGWQYLNHELDRDVQIIGYGNQGLLIHYVDDLHACLAFIKTGGIEKVEMGLISSRIDADVSGNIIAFIGQSPTTFPEVYRFDGQSQALTNISRNDLTLTDVDFGQAERFEWFSEDGLPLHGVLRFAGDKARLSKAPLVVVVHGGPKDFAEHQLFSGYHWFAPYLPLLAMGYLILEPNYRGSLGRGQKFAQANVGALGVLDCKDICDGVDALAQTLPIDMSNTVCIGWSQGGFIAAYSGFHRTTFSKVIAGAAISDWYTYAQLTDIPSFVDDYLPHRKPLTMEQVANSSVTGKKPVNRPATLLFHGKQDSRVPAKCGEQLVAYCREHQIEHQGYLIEGMRHRIERPSQLRLVLEKSLQWLLQP